MSHILKAFTDSEFALFQQSLRSPALDALTKIQARNADLLAQVIPKFESPLIAGQIMGPIRNIHEQLLSGYHPLKDVLEKFNRDIAANLRVPLMAPETFEALLHAARGLDAQGLAVEVQPDARPQIVAAIWITLYLLVVMGTASGVGASAASRSASGVITNLAALLGSLLALYEKTADSGD